MDSKKNLLNEATVRRFMKLAELEPLVNPFVENIAPEPVVTEDEEDPTPEEAEYDAAYEDEGFEAGEEAAEDADLGMEDEIEAAGAEAGMEEKVKDFLEDVAAAATKHLGVATEVETDTEEVEDVAAMDIDAEQDMELDIADMDDTEVVDVDDVELQETGAKRTGASKGDKGKDADDPTARDYTDGGDRKDDESKTHPGRKDYMEEDKPFTAKKEKPGADMRKGAEKRGAEGTKKKTSGKGRGEKKGDDAYVNEDNDRIAEEITRRVIARLLNTKD